MFDDLDLEDLEIKRQAWKVVRKQYPDMTFQQFLEVEQQAIDTIRKEMIKRGYAEYEHMTDEEIEDLLVEAHKENKKNAKP